MENKHSLCWKAKFSAGVKWCSPVPANRAILVYVSREADPEGFLFACSKVSGCVTSLRERTDPGHLERMVILGAEPL